MTNPSYTDEQVRQLIKWHEEMGYPIAVAAISSLFSDRQRLQAEVEALRPDAERYRWLREDHRAVERDGSVYVRWVQMTGGVITGSDILTERDLDMVIDAARVTPNETK